MIEEDFETFVDGLLHWKLSEAHNAWAALNGFSLHTIWSFQSDVKDKVLSEKSSKTSRPSTQICMTFKYPSRKSPNHPSMCLNLKIFNLVTQCKAFNHIDQRNLSFQQLQNKLDDWLIASLAQQEFFSHSPRRQVFEIRNEKTHLHPTPYTLLMKKEHGKNFSLVEDSAGFSGICHLPSRRQAFLSCLIQSLCVLAARLGRSWSQFH